MTTTGTATRGAPGEQEQQPGDHPFGARFIHRLRELGCSLGSLRPEDIERITRADRRELIGILSRRHSMLPHRLIEGIRDFEPEDLAVAMSRDRQMMWSFLLLALS
jgi:hypothetical protein